MNLEPIRKRCKELSPKQLMNGLAKYAMTSISAEQRYMIDPIIQCATDEIDSRRAEHKDEWLKSLEKK